MKQQEIKRKQIICYTYIIGLMGMMGLGKVLGDEGMAFLAVAMEGISLFTMLVTFGVSGTIARLQKNRRNKGQFKGAARMRGQFLLLQGITGGLLTMVLLLLADTLAQRVFGVPHSVWAMKLLAPVILIQALDAALLGYFQGCGRHIPSLISAVLRQGFFLVFGSLFGRRLTGYGDKVSNLLKNSSYRGMYGALGVALGILITELLVLLFLIVIYMVSDRKADEQRSQEGLRRTESMGDIVRVFYGAVWQGLCAMLLVLLPVLLGAAFYLRVTSQMYSPISTLVPPALSTAAPTALPETDPTSSASDPTALPETDPASTASDPTALPETDLASTASDLTALPEADPASTPGTDENVSEAVPLAELAAHRAAADYGSFFGKCFLLCAVFVLILAARCFPVYGRLLAAIRREDIRYTRDVAASGLHYVWAVGLYFTVTMAVMAPQMAAGFFPGRDAGVDGMLRLGSILILLTALVILFSVILLAHGERYILLGMLGIWMILDVILQNLFIKGSDYSVTGILSGTLTATLILAAGLLAYCIWRRRINTEYIRILGVPLVGAGIMGLVMMLATRLLGAHMSSLVTLVVAALLGAVVYGVILVMTKNIREYEISVLYGKQARKLLERIIS